MNKHFVGAGHIGRSKMEDILSDVPPSQEEITNTDFCIYMSKCKKFNNCSNDTICRLRDFYCHYPNYDEDNVLGVGAKL